MLRRPQPTQHNDLHTLLISDLHLSPAQPALTTAFETFLHQQASQCEALYILGDLFEAWVGDDDPAPLAQAVIKNLKTLTEHGTRLYFLHGNRDFAIGRRFARETGCALLKELEVVNLYGEEVLLLHGDTLCTEDKEYQRARRLIRNPVLLAIMKRLPLKIRQQIAISGRKKSMAATGNKSDAIMDVSQQAVDSTLVHYGVTNMIHGHTHRPCDHDIELNIEGHKQSARRIVLGDWHDKGWVIKASASGLELQSFAI